MLKVQLIGNIGKDATLNNVNGKNVINFNVAHNEKYKDANGAEVNKTTWINCSFWVDRMGLVPHLKKGTLVYVEGKPDAKMYDKDNGEKAASLSIKVSSVELLSSSKNNENA